MTIRHYKALDVICWFGNKTNTKTCEEELTEVSALWFLQMTLVNGSEVPEMSLGAKSLQIIMTQPDK